jgi:hypothetical protein
MNRSLLIAAVALPLFVSSHHDRWALALAAVGAREAG